MCFGVDWCSWVSVWIGVVGFQCRSVLVLVVFERQRHGFWCESAVEVWISCGSAMVVCDCNGVVPTWLHQRL